MKTSAQLSESIKAYVQETIMAYQHGAGSPDAPFTADLAISAIWRHIDVVMYEDLKGARLRIEASQDKRGDLLQAIGELQPESAQQVGGRMENHKDVWYVWIPAKTFIDLFQAIVVLKKAGAEVRDWQYYAPEPELDAGEKE